jgi:hypothetical protein
MRWFGFIDDPVASGSTLEDLDTGNIPVPTTFVPVTSAQVDPGLQPLDRDNEVRGRRGNTPPMSFASAPSLTFEGRAYPKLVRSLVRKALSGSISSTGTAPAAISSTVGPLQTGSLKALIGWLVREGELDRVAGAVVNELELNFAIDAEGTVSGTLPALYHDVDDVTAIDDPSGDAGLALPTAAYPGYTDTFMLRDASAFRGASLTELTDLAGFGFTFNNNLIDDMRSRFLPNHNIETVSIDSVEHRIWYPQRHKLGPQQVTGRIDFSDVDPDAELRRIVTHAEKLVFEVAAGPLGTTPAADEMLRLIFYKQAPTGGGPEPLQREGDQVSSYEFTAYVDDITGKDLEAVLVGAAALT